jgi:CRISPR system Cascade subunit CasE
MYLSRLQLNPNNRLLWRSVIDQPYKLHQLVMGGFPDGVDRQKGNVLHRLELAENQVTLLVQSDVYPDWRSFDARLLLPTTSYDPVPNPAVQDMNGLRLVNGRLLRFRLRANPSKRLSSGQGNKPGPRVQHFREDEQIAWLQRHAQRSGFRILDVNIAPEGNQTDRIRKLTVFTVQFDGRLQVTDPDKLLAAVQRGIGPAKAFGCGLLSLAPG